MFIDEDIYLEHSDNNVIIDQDVDDFLEHYGVKGMKWGVRNERRAIRKASGQELKKLVKRNTASENATRKDPTFKREVKATKKKKGITGGTSAQKTKVGGVLTGRILGDFKNSKGEKVSADFANAVLNKSIKKVNAGQVAAGAMLITYGALQLSAFKRGVSLNPFERVEKWY
jgi:hypothetical protein